MPHRLPPLSILVDAADAGLHPWVRARVPESDRRAALEQELSFWLDTAARDLMYADAYRRSAPPRGLPPEAYLDRWLPVGSQAHVLAGPRYLGMNPDLPFVGVSAGDRQLVPADSEALVALARREFAAFAPGFVMFTTADALGSWPGGEPEMRSVVGSLGDLRRRRVPAELTTVPRTDTGFYGRYRLIHEAQVARQPEHGRHAHLESRADLEALAREGLLFDIRVEGAWAGILAAQRDARHGLHGVTVVELLLDHPFRRRGLGRHLSALLAAAVPLPDTDYLLGTIHVDNQAAYRAALGAGRVDIGGEIRIPL